MNENENSGVKSTTRQSLHEDFRSDNNVCIFCGSHDLGANPLHRLTSTESKRAIAIAASYLSDSKVLNALQS